MEKYVVITESMIKELGLKGNDLLIYAIIYGFTQDGESDFTGSLQYLADWTNSTKRSVMNNLNNLVEKELITKKEYIRNGVRFCTYATNFTSMEKFSIPMEKISTNNIEDNIVKENNNNNIIVKESSVLRFKKPTLQEVEAYCKERNNGINAQCFIDFYESKGWKIGSNPMKDWKACVRTWEQHNYGSYKQKPTQVARDYEERKYTKEELESVYTDIDTFSEEDL